MAREIEELKYVLRIRFKAMNKNVVIKQGFNEHGQEYLEIVQPGSLEMDMAPTDTGGITFVGEGAEIPNAVTRIVKEKLENTEHYISISNGLKRISTTVCLGENPEKIQCPSED